jgi:hypothetical protein
MRLAFFGVAAVIAASSSEPARSYDMPYDPYPWCAFTQAMVAAAPTAAFSHSNSAGRP